MPILDLKILRFLFAILPSSVVPAFYERFGAIFKWRSPNCTNSSTRLQFRRERTLSSGSFLLVIDHTFSRADSRRAIRRRSPPAERTIFDLFTSSHEAADRCQAILGLATAQVSARSIHVSASLSKQSSFLPFPSGPTGRGRRSRVTDRMCARQSYKRRRTMCVARRNVGVSHGCSERHDSVGKPRNRPTGLHAARLGPMAPS